MVKKRYWVDAEGINRNIVECKELNGLDLSTVNSRINRNIVECKGKEII